MAFNEQLAERVSRVLKEKHVAFEEKHMFGGLCFMVDEKMCVGIVKEELMVRINPDITAGLQEAGGVRPMDFTGRSMNGYLFVSPAAVDLDADLEAWVQRCLDFNPLAKKSKKKKPKAS